MQIKENEILRNHTTIRIGGIAKRLYFPESKDELIGIVRSLQGKKLYILGGGSNLLINDEKTFEEVVSLKLMDTSIEILGEGKYYVGASVPMQKLIMRINDDGYGGIEYLMSVPALVGGAVAMNAGRGRTHNLSIGDYVQKVLVYDTDKQTSKTLTKDECQFGYRQSIFKKNQSIVMGVFFEFPSIDADAAKKMRKERMEYVRRYQDQSGNNFGSVFREYNRYIMQVFKWLHLGNHSGVAYSLKTSNWLINNGDGTYREARILIDKAIRFHQFFGQRAIPEVIFWD